MPVDLHGQDFAYTNMNGSITITGYTGSGGDVTIPSAINGQPVVALGDGSFGYRTNLTAVMIPNSVVEIGKHAFEACDVLTNVVMRGNVADIGDSAFSGCRQPADGAPPRQPDQFREGCLFWMWQSNHYRGRPV